MDRIGYSVRIFVPQGEPEGLRLVEKSNWVGVGLVFPRTLFSEAMVRPEAKRTGVYVLWGDSEVGGLPRVYIGEGDTTENRVTRHYSEKEFWTHGVIFSSKDQGLNKAHIQHLEARLVAIARGAKRCELENGNVPQPPTLSEADIADAESYLRDMLLCLPVIGVSFFEPAQVKPAVHAPELFLKLRGITAQGFEAPQGFIVRAGSTAALDETESAHEFIKAMRKSLIENEALIMDGDKYRLTLDYRFGSPSTAAGVMLGRNSNGRVDWRDGSGRTLKELQES